MAAEINPVSPASSSDEKVSQVTPIDEKHDLKDIIEPYVADLEDGDGCDAEIKRLAEKAEAVELTPVEAFKWNVDGDQSPCQSTIRCLTTSYPRYTDMACSPRGCCLCSQHGRSRHAVQQ